MPIEKATPASEITLMVRPASNSPMKAAMVQMGMPITPTSVMRADLRNRYMTSVASTAPSARLRQTVAMDCST